MKHYELIANGCFYDYCYASSLKKAREQFEPKWSGSYTIICTGNDWERKNVRFK
jgi:hypothetical protein